jgi:predicted nucleic acid-binding protein
VSTALLDTSAVLRVISLGIDLSPWDDIAVSVVTLGEVLRGFLADPNPLRQGEVDLARAMLVNIDGAIADRWASVRAATPRKKLGDNDVWIVATALSLGATIVSCDAGMIECADALGAATFAFSQSA